MSYFRKILTLTMVVLMMALPMVSNPAFAQVILRDAEAEWFIRKVSTPIFEAAGLTPSAVEIYLIYDNSINAFAFYQNMALHSGLIQKADNLNQVIGVIAHETGHIAGGHSARIQEGAKRSLGIMLVSVLLGIAAAAAGSGDAAAGLILGGQTMAQRAFLTYSRVQEATADQAAVTYLEATGTSGRGLMEFFDKLRDQELLAHIRQDPYVRTHPVSGDRLLRLATRVTNSRYYNTPTSPEDVYWFNRVKAKLDGYVNEPYVTFRDYPVYDTSEFALYARVYAYQKDLQFDKALEEAHTLLDQRPNDPFYNEITGQILFERGKIDESIPYFEKAFNALPRQPLIMTALGHALVALDTEESNLRARKILEQAVFYDRYNDFAWRQLAVIYARLGMEDRANLATAEMWLLERRYQGAIRRGQIAMQAFPEGSREWVQAQDVVLTASQFMRDQKGNGRRASPLAGRN
ncbi:MAG: M48 family metalloprotease [Sphingomonadales bacterium]